MRLPFKMRKSVTMLFRPPRNGHAHPTARVRTE